MKNYLIAVFGIFCTVFTIVYLVKCFIYNTWSNPMDYFGRYVYDYTDIFTGKEIYKYETNPVGRLYVAILLIVSIFFGLAVFIEGEELTETNR